MKYEDDWAENNILQVYKGKEDIPDPHKVGFGVELIPWQFRVSLVYRNFFVRVIIVRIIIIIRLWLVHHFFQLSILYVNFDLIETKAQENKHPDLRPEVFNALTTFFLVHFFPGFMQVRSLFHESGHFYAISPLLCYFVVLETFLTLLFQDVASWSSVLIALSICLS